MAAPPAPTPTVADSTDYLDEDLITVPGQNYVLLSFVSPSSRQKSDKLAMKVRGVFNTVEEANGHVRKLMRMDSSVDIFVASVGKWLPIPPDANAVEDQEYGEQFLNDLMKGYKESQLAAKQHFAERKRAVMESGLESVPPDTFFTAHDPHPASTAGGSPDGSAAGPSGST